MGNSGSMHNMAGLDEHLRHTSTMSAAQQQQKQFQDHLLKTSSAQMEWSGARPARQPQVKVLPSLIDSSARHLRPTNNGNILHNGGTLSGRKESIVRSRSAHPTIAPQPAKRLHSRLMQRSQTQLQLIRDEDNDHRPSTATALPSFKRFDSEPDLRGSATNDATEVPAKPTLTRSTAAGGKKKKAAAPPPPIARAIVTPPKTSDAYDPERFGWRATAKIPAEAEVTPRKLRLFKTKAESRKSSNVPVGTSTKINTEASDHYFQRTIVALHSVGKVTLNLIKFWRFFSSILLLLIHRIIFFQNRPIADRAMRNSSKACRPISIKSRPRVCHQISIAYQTVHSGQRIVFAYFQRTLINFVVRNHSM